MGELNEIIKKWNNKFPLLKRYTKLNLFLKADIFMIGLSFDREGNVYGITVVMYPLWMKEKLYWPMFYLLYGEILNFKGIRINVSDFKLDGSDESFDINVKNVEKYFGDILCNNICLRDIVRHQYEFCELNILNPLYEQNFFEMLFAIALYYEDTSLFEETKKLLIKRLKKWNIKHFEALFKMSKEQWLEEMLERFSDRDRFMSIIEENWQNPKVKKLNEAHIIYETIVPKELPDIPRLERIKKFLRRNLGEAWI